MQKIGGKTANQTNLLSMHVVDVTLLASESTGPGVIDLLSDCASGALDRVSVAALKGVAAFLEVLLDLG